MNRATTEKRLEAVEYWQFVRRIAGLVSPEHRGKAWKAARATPRGDGSPPLVALLNSLPVEEGRRVVAAVEETRATTEKR